METIELDLTLEQLGNIAIYAHNRDITINNAIEQILRKYIERETQSTTPFKPSLSKLE